MTRAPTPSSAKLAIAFVLVCSAFAQASEREEAEKQNAAWAEVVRVCSADLAANECGDKKVEAIGIVAKALTDLGASKDKASAPLLRHYAKADEPVIRVAVAYGLAMLGPEIEDILVLRELINDNVPAVRQAARAAYDKSAFRVAMQLRERMGPYDKAEANTYEEDALPFDASALGAALPQDAVFLQFERDEIKLGAFLFVTGETEDALLAALAGASGRESKPLADVTSWFPPGTLDRWVNTTFFENVRVVALADGTGADAGKPVRLALVYRDVQMEKTGLALQWVPAEGIPAIVPTVETPEAAQKGIEATLPDDGSVWLTAIASERSDRIKREADPLDTAFWLSAVDSGDGVEDYLREFPSGAYRAEAEDYLANAVTVTAADLQVEPGESVVINFRNAPYEQNPVITIALPEAPGEDALVTGFTRGSKSGEETLIAPSTPGVYEVRLVKNSTILASSELRVGEPAMDETGAVVVSTPAEAPATTPTAPESAAAPSVTDAPPPASTPSSDPYASFTAPTVTLDKNEFAAAEKIVVHLKGMPGKPNDWVTIVTEGTSEETWGVYQYTGGFVDGDLTFDAPAQPGRYEVRIYFDEPAGGKIVRAKVVFDVKS